MPTLKIFLIKCSLITLFIALTSFMASASVYPYDADREASDSTFLPGYIKAAKYKMESTANEKEAQKSLLQDVETAQNKAADKIKDQKQDKNAMTLDLKHKMSNPAGKGRKAIIDSTLYNVDLANADIHTVTTASGITVAYAEINGVTHVLAGFTEYGESCDSASLQAAIQFAAGSEGSIVLVHGGDYGSLADSWRLNITDPTGGSARDFRILAGYDNYGNRDIVANRTSFYGDITIDNFSASVEINGFTFEPTYHSIMASSGTTMLINDNFISDNMIGQCGWMVIVNGGFLIARNNEFNGYGTNAGGIYVCNGGTIASFGNNYDTLLWGISGNEDSSASSTDDYCGSGDLTTGHVPYSVTDRRTTPDRPNQAQYDTKISAGDSKNSDLTPAINPDKDKVNDNDIFLNLKALGMKDEKLGNILKDLLINGDALVLSGPDKINGKLLAELDQGSLGKSALAIQGPPGNDEMDIAMRLTMALKGLKGEQKIMMAAMKALINNTGKVEEESGVKTDPDLRSLEDKLLEMAGRLLLGQAIPDLLKKGDMVNVAVVFDNMDHVMKAIMFQYDESVKPYYDRVREELIKNISAPRIKNILAVGTSEEDLHKFTPAQLQKILKRIREDKDRTPEEEYILSQIAIYDQKYLKPGQDRLKKDMENLLKNSMSKISGILKSLEKK